ncbi:apyrase-like isoform X1 [Diorhabda carinulata]|uniref:apyrase-like isoform X1 n=2 Tax=Diorhabda carinulata TaxID=1163345 RepID=UPI00259FE848|nr:apyrase-like isoform X1 [Diorhabda carinulata]
MKIAASVIFFVICAIFYIDASPNKRISDLFELSVVHFNDFHARFDPINLGGNTCKTGEECIGGFSRLYKEIMNLLNEKPKALLLNGGDNFQGTLWYTIGKWNVTQEFINKLPIEAEVLGNHEFDDGIDGIVPYIKALKHPIIVSNIDDSLEPSIQGTYKKSVVIERNGKKIGIVGVLTADCANLSSTGKLVFHDESASVNAEAERLVKEENVYTVIVLSHSGYDVDKKIAQNASEKISLIVGAHSHSFLWTGDNPPGPDTVQGPYPTIIESKNGHNVLVTQASCYTKFVGNITVYLDETGEAVDWSGAPIYLDSSSPQDEEINEQMKPWKDKVDGEGNRVIGSSLVTLSKKHCYVRECALGNFVTDAMVYEYTKSVPEGSWTNVALAITNAGSLRADISAGNITFSDLMTAQPFGNTIDYGSIQGKYLKEMFEHGANAVSYTGSTTASLNLLQHSGFIVEIDTGKPAGQRVVSLKVRCQNCTVPVYNDIEMERYYKLSVNSFLASGGDGYSMIAENMINKHVGRHDFDIMMEYLDHRSPVFQEEGKRSTVFNETTLFQISR